MRLQEVKQLKLLLRASEAYRNNYYSLAEWGGYEDLWEGNYNLQPRADGSENPTLTVPILVSDSQRQMASILGNDPRIEVYADDPELYPAARVLSSKLQHMMEILGLMDQTRDAAQDTGTCGTGFLMHGFGSQYGTHPDTVRDGFDSTRQDSDDRRIEFHANVLDNMPWTLRAHPSTILLPPGIVRLAEAYGYFHIYQRHKDDLSADDKLDRKHRQALQPDSAYDTLTRTNNYRTTGSMFTAGSAKGPEDTAIELCTLVDWIDLRTNRRITFSPYYKSALRDEVDEVLIRLNRLNLEAIIWTQPSRGFWGTSDFKLQMPVADEYNDIRTMQVRHRHTEVIKAFINKDWLELDGENQQEIENAIEKMSNDQVAAFILGNGNPSEAIAFHAPGQPRDLYPQLEVCLQNIREFGSGQGPLQKGQMSTGRHTKYETQSAEGYSDQMLFPRRKVVRKAIISTLKTWATLGFDFWTEPQLVKTYDAAGNPVTVEFKGGDLRGDYRFHISLDSMGTRGRNERVEEANMILSQLQPYTQPQASGQPVVDAHNLVRQYLAKVTQGDWDIEELLVNQEQPQKPPQPYGQFAQQFMQQQQQDPGLAQLIQQSGGV